jgi:Flp pilus assembly protein TadG
MNRFKERQEVSKTAKYSLLRRIARFVKNENKGVAALEFALIAPVMITLYIGSVEFYRAFSADRRVTDLASAAADLVAQSADMTSDKMNNIFDAASTYLKPFGIDKLKITITSICHAKDASDNEMGKVDWSANFNQGAGGVHSYNHGDNIALPKDSGGNPVLTIQGQSLIFAEVEYEYTSPLGKYVNHLTLSDKYYLRPRLRETPSVINEDAGGAQKGCAAAEFNGG